jgi:2-oxoisovalerate dehydrogenase E1 component alpha subunit
VRFRKYLGERKLWDDAKEESLQEQIKAEILTAIAEAEKFGQPPVESMFEDVFAGVPDHLREQREYLLDYLKRNPRSAEVK